MTPQKGSLHSLHPPGTDFSAANRTTETTRYSIDACCCCCSRPTPITMPGPRLPSTPSGTTPTRVPGGSHRRKRTCRSEIRDGPTTEEKKKRQRITPSPSSPTSPTVRVDLDMERLVPTITQTPPTSSTSGLETPRRSPRLKARPTLLSNVAAAVKSKQKVLGFKLDNNTIYAWFRDDLKPFVSTSSSSLKKKAQHNFGRIQHKERQVQAEVGKSQRIATNSKNKPTKSKPLKSTKGLKTPPSSIPTSILSTRTIESTSYRQYLIEDFLYTNVGDRLLLQIALDHPNYASYSRLYENSTPKPLRNISGRTFVQLPCVVTLHSRQAQLIDGTLDRRDVHHLLFENGNGSIGVSISDANSAESTEIFIFWNEVFAHPYTFEVGSHDLATSSFRMLFKDGLPSLDSC